MDRSLKARLAFAFVLFPTTFAAATERVVSEAEAIRLYQSTSPRVLMVGPIERSASAELRRDARPPDPQIAYQIEDAAGVRDRFLTLEQELPLPGRRRLARDAADAAARAAGLVARRRAAEGAWAMLAAFHDVLYRQRSLARLREGARRLEPMVELLRRREEEGEGSGYDVLRAEQELASLRIDRAQAEAAVTSARARFGSFFDPALEMEDASLVGELAPAGPPPDPALATERALSGRADLRALEAEQQRFEFQQRAAKRRRFPDPGLTAGLKRTDSPGLDDTGFVAAVTVAVPIFDRGRLAAAWAQAERQRLELEAEILRREIRADVQAAVARELAARESAERLGQAIGQRASELRAIAMLRYEEGAGGILELLDAHRTALATELRALDARHDARRAEIDRRRIVGDEVTP